MDTPPLAVKIHCQSFADRGGIGTVHQVADNMGILMKADTLYLFIIDRIDFVGRGCKPVAGVIIPVDVAYLLRGAAQVVFDLKIRAYAQNAANIAEAVLLMICDMRNILCRFCICAVVENVMFTL